MALPPRPTAPAQALRSNPDTFSLNAELAINYQWTAFPNWIEAMGDFVVARAEEANAAALTGAITPAPEFAAHYLRLNSGGTALEYRSPAETAGDLGLMGRNLIINGSGRINQRGYVSGAATSGANQFTLDRWFVITSGQNLTFTGNDSGRVMTAPAGGVSQVIEGANIAGGTYVLNWTGTATATVGGVARTKGEVFTLTANTNVTVTFTGGTFSEVQLELGSIVTPFEFRSFLEEFARCVGYYEKSYRYGDALGTNTTNGIEDFVAGGGSGIGRVTFTQKNKQPVIRIWDAGGTVGTITTFTPGENSGQGPSAVDDISEKGFKVFISQGSISRMRFHWEADAEITS